MSHLYEDKAGIIHSCEKEQGSVRDRHKLVWTKCGKDVPANKSFISMEPPTCKECLEQQQ